MISTHTNKFRKTTPIKVTTIQIKSILKRHWEAQQSVSSVHNSCLNFKLGGNNLLYDVIHDKKFLNPRNILEIRGIFGSRPVYYPDKKSDFCKPFVLKYWLKHQNFRLLCPSCNRLVPKIKKHYPVCEQKQKELDLKYLQENFIHRRPLWLGFYSEFADFRRFFRRLRRRKQAERNKEFRELQAFLRNRRGSGTPNSKSCDIRQVYREAKQFSITRVEILDWQQAFHCEKLKKRLEAGLDPDPDWN